MYFDFITFLSAFSLPIILIALLTLPISILADKFLFAKLPDIVKTLFPFAVSCIIYLLYGYFFGSEHGFDLQTLSSGLICGSLSSIFITFINNLKSGKINFDPLALSIQGLVKYYVKDSYSLSIRIANVIRANYTAENSEKLQDILTVILKKSCENIKSEDIKTVSDEILSYARKILK